MERNKLLNLAAIVCSVLSALQIAGITIATIVLIHWHTDKEFYRGVKINSSGNVNVSSRTSEKQERPTGTIWIEKSEEPEIGKVTLADLTPASVYFLYAKAVASMVVLFFIFREFGKIVRSVSAMQTFRTDNIDSFRKIGKNFLILFLVSSFHFVATDPSGGNISFDFDITPLVLMLVAYVLAEIFKEGNRLYEEEQLTV